MYQLHNGVPRPVRRGDGRGLDRRPSVQARVRMTAGAGSPGNADAHTAPRRRVRVPRRAAILARCRAF